MSISDERILIGACSLFKLTISSVIALGFPSKRKKSFVIAHPKPPTSASLVQIFSSNSPSPKNLSSRMIQYSCLTTCRAPVQIKIPADKRPSTIPTIGITSTHFSRGSLFFLSNHGFFASPFLIRREWKYLGLSGATGEIGVVGALMLVLLLLLLPASLTATLGFG